jgi:hypothetical protein
MLDVVLILVAKPTEEIQQFRADPWPFQRTFQTPLKDLQRFVLTLLAPFALQKGALVTDQIVFEPENLLKLMARHSISVENIWQFTCEAEGAQCIAELIEAALGDWVDFCFVPTPASFAIYADHDEYVTFYAGEESQIAMIASRLERAGFSPVADYVRPYVG